jgi:chloramphenicol 3-O phosphotransferase
MPLPPWRPSGNNLIADDVMLNNEHGEYAALLSGFETFSLAFCAAGCFDSRWQRGESDDRSFPGNTTGFTAQKYDLEIDTGSLNPLECAALIKQKFKTMLGVLLFILTC